jgi:phospholipase/lecithinase/hemolysin
MVVVSFPTMRWSFGRHGCLAAAVLAATCIAAGAGAQQPVPTRLFVLGDSLSDVGNAAAFAEFGLGESLAPPSTFGLCNLADFYLHERGCGDVFYRQSRVSDGPVAVEHLAEHLQLGELQPSLHFLPHRSTGGTNYAVASAKASAQGPEDLSSQVDLLLIQHGPLLPADALYVVIIGGNDAIDALQAAAGASATTLAPPALPEPGPDAVVAAAVAAIAANVERLIDFGAGRLIVANVPDLAALPAVRMRAATSPAAARLLAAASAVSTAFNRELAEALERIATKPGAFRPVRLASFDLASELQRVQSEGASEGRNAVDACFDSETYWASATAERRFHPACAPTSGGPLFKAFVFWDGIHPTGAAHAALGAALISVYEREIANESAASDDHRSLVKAMSSPRRR